MAKKKTVKKDQKVETKILSATQLAALNGLQHKMQVVDMQLMHEQLKAEKIKVELELADTKRELIESQLNNAQLICREKKQQKISILLENQRVVKEMSDAMGLEKPFKGFDPMTGELALTEGETDG